MFSIEKLALPASKEFTAHSDTQEHQTNMINTNIFKNNKIILSIFSLIIILIMLNLLLERKQQKLSFISVKPSQTSGIALDQSFRFIFNKSPENITIKTNPSFAFSKSISGNSLFIHPNNKLSSLKQYNIAIIDNDAPLHTHTFTTIGVSESEIITKDEEKTLNLYPL